MHADRNRATRGGGAFVADSISRVVMQRSSRPVIRAQYVSG
jgi:hypothetical protein